MANTAGKKTITLDDIEYKNVPNQQKIDELMKDLEANKHIVIIGAGIIGVCTAYYLTRHQDFDSTKHHITLLESTRVAGGASGKSGGLLATWAFPLQIAPYSFQLHQELADEHGGSDLWDYRRLTSLSIEADIRDEYIKQKQNNLNEGNSNKESSNAKKSGKLKEVNGCCIPSGENFASTVATKPDFDFGSEAVGNGRSNSKLGFMDSDDSDSDEFMDFAAGPQMMNRAMPTSELNAPSLMSREVSDAPHTLENDEAHLNEKLPSDLNWINKALVNQWTPLGGKDSTAIVHPFKFTIFLLQKAIETGAVDLVMGSITKLYFNNDITNEMDSESTERRTDVEDFHINGVDYIQTDDSIPENERKTVHLKATQVIVCMGPWTSKILKDCPVNGLRAHSIIVKPSTKQTDGLNNNTNTEISPFAIFSELRCSDSEYFSPELYVRKDEIYICGEGDTMTELPDTTAQVEVLDKRCQELYTNSSKMSSMIASGHITKKQACYLPIVNVPTTTGPLLGETNATGLYVGVGHSCWGINNAPASGKLLSQLIFEGEFKDADLSTLDPTLYFDASI